jgi:pimeloyl-ACP methyl ester carboxylesterase
MYVEHLRIPIGAGTLHVERLGRGSAAVVLLHGFGTSASLWRGVAPPLAEAGFVAVAPDLLGNGESDRPLDARYDLGSQADALDRALAALRIAEAVVVGQDVGGLVALALASRHPTRVSRLVLVNPPDLEALPPVPVRAMQRAASRLALGAGRGLLGAAALLSPLLADGVTDAAQLPPASMARYLAPWVGAGGVEQLQQLARDLEEGGGLTADDLALIETPTVIIRADGDRTVAPTVAVGLARSLPNARLLTMHGVGRLLAEDAPTSLAEALLRILREDELSAKAVRRA